MISREIIKEIIIENENFILNQVGEISSRQDIVFPEKLRKIKIIYGPRRSGKTFLLYHLFRKHHPSSLYIDFEDERINGIELKELNEIKEVFFELKPNLIHSDNVVFLFDEIQNIKGWEKFARRLVEREEIDLYVAGSSSKIKPQYVHTALRGRQWSIAIFPFSFVEFLQIKGLDLRGSLYGREKSLLQSYLGQYIKYGGFPEVVLTENEFVKAKVLNEYIEAMFFKDLVEQFKIKNITLLEVLKENLFSSFATKFSLTSFFKNYRGKFPFSKTSLFNYYKHFLSSMLIFESRLFADSAYRRMRNPAKIYLVDIGLSRRIKTEDYGRVLENIVFLELRRRGYDLFYFAAENECDFIVHGSGGDYQAVQVTWEITNDNQKREYSGLIQACKGIKKHRGTIITVSQDAKQKIDGVVLEVIPFARWLANLQTRQSHIMGQTKGWKK